MILILLQILVAVAAGDASEDGSGEISREESELGSGQQDGEFSESPGGGGAVERQRNLNRIFDVLTEINPEALFEDYKYQDNNESSDLSNGNGDNDVASNSVEWKNASSESESESGDSEFDISESGGQELETNLMAGNLTGEREERGRGNPRLRIENDVHSFFNLFPINEHVISNIVHNITKAFQRDILGQKDETEDFEKSTASHTQSPVTVPEKIGTHAPVVERDSGLERGDQAEISFENTTDIGQSEVSTEKYEPKTSETEAKENATELDVQESVIDDTTTESGDVTEPLDVLKTNESSTISSAAGGEDTTALYESYQEEEEVDGRPCECICDSNLRYLLPEGRDLEEEDEVTIVLQDESGTTLCSEEETQRCCTDIVFESLPEELHSKENKPQPRFKFPCQRGWTGPDCTEREKGITAVEEEDFVDVPLEEVESHLGETDVGNATLGEVNISESILVDTDGIPQLCLPYLKETTTPSPTTTTTTNLPTVNDRIIFGTMALDEPEVERGVNETIEAKGSWLVTVHLNKTSQLKLRLASRTPISCLARRGARPSLLHFDILATVDGTSREPLYWNLAPGEWFIQLHNEENFDQEVVLSMAREDADGPACCKEGCRLVGGRQECPGEECLHGKDRGSRCICDGGWFGPRCNLTSLECRDGVCGSRGECLQQIGSLGFETIICDCDPGSTGDGCEKDEKEESERKKEEEDCQCGEQGVCREGLCRWGR